MSDATNRAAESRFVATLLFQYRVTVDGRNGRVRTCEKRMLVLKAASATIALKVARSRGKAAEHPFRNSDGNPVRFEFVGVLDLLRLGEECEEDEVWYDVVRMREPMERRETILPDESRLSAIAEERGERPARSMR